MTAEAPPSTPLQGNANPTENRLCVRGRGQLRLRSGRYATGAPLARRDGGYGRRLQRGAMNAAYFAGMPTAEGVERLAVIWRSLRRHDVFPITWRTMVGFIRRHDFLIAADGVRRLIDSHVPYGDLEDAKLPLHVVATDLLSGETVVLSKGPVAQAVVASTAIPAAFAPVQLENLYLADGAITGNTPIRVGAASLLSRSAGRLPTWRARARPSRRPTPSTSSRARIGTQFSRSCMPR
jgi:Patatin-like phospholipase